jgi:mono/diheme cytochrome c family protein
MDELQDQNAKIVDLAGGAGLIPGGGNPPLGAPNAGLSADLDDLAAYVASLRHRSATPFPAGSAEADSGEALFHDAVVGCADCHSGPLYTDSSLLGGPPFVRHDVGTADSTDAEGAAGFDTPSLVGVWDTGPYLHDNRAETLHDVLTVHNAGDLHGTTSHLSAAQIDYLVAFLETIADTAGVPEIVPTGSPVAVGPAVTGTYFDAVFPNPFRHETSVRFSLERPSDVVVEVFNVEGRRVRTVVHARMPRGVHVVGWDATNDGGHRVGAGMYFARLLVDGERKGNRKLTILR